VGKNRRGKEKNQTLTGKGGGSIEKEGLGAGGKSRKPPKVGKTGGRKTMKRAGGIRKKKKKWGGFVSKLLRGTTIYVGGNASKKKGG